MNNELLQRALTEGWPKGCPYFLRISTGEKLFTCSGFTPIMLSWKVTDYSPEVIGTLKKTLDAMTPIIASVAAAWWESKVSTGSEYRKKADLWRSLIKF